MAKATMVWDGFQEYLDELRKLPEDCAVEAANLTESGVNAAYQTISQVYGQHRFTGTLQSRLRIKTVRVGRLIKGLVLESGSPIAWLFDNGSQARHWASGKSTGKMWGRTAPTHIFAKTVARERRKLTQQFKDMLLRRGATSVVGE
jgi:hypothetical protein